MEISWCSWDEQWVIETRDGQRLSPHPALHYMLDDPDLDDDNQEALVKSAIRWEGIGTSHADNDVWTADEENGCPICWERLDREAPHIAEAIRDAYQFCGTVPAWTLQCAHGAPAFAPGILREGKENDE